MEEATIILTSYYTTGQAFFEKIPGLFLVKLLPDDYSIRFTYV